MNLAQELARSLGHDALIHETHVSWVITAGAGAYKLKKPLRYPFVDQSTPELRRALCEEELRVNQPLAASVVVAVAAIVRGPDGLQLADPEAPGALDHVVVMRRFREADTLAARLATGRVRDAALFDLGGLLAGFHASAERARDLEGPARRWACNLAELADALGDVDETVLATLGSFGAAQARRWAPELARRAAQGLVVDGHGDLRAEHVLIEGDRTLVVDRLEFDASLRRADVAEDLAFLTMDLERLGAGWAAERVLDGYRAAGGDPGPPELLAYFGAYRALVRAKVAGLAGRRPEADGLIDLALELSWRARRPLRLVVTGAPASGKSTLAAALAGAASVPRIASDTVRPRDDDGHGRYDAASRIAVYRTLGHAARRLDSFVIDATFGEPALQEAFLEAAGDVERLSVIECDAPAEILIRRAAERRGDGNAESEAGPEVVAALLDRQVPFHPAGGSRLRVDGTADTRAVVAQVAQWLDRAHS